MTFSLDKKIKEHEELVGVIPEWLKTTKEISNISKSLDMWIDAK